MQSSNYHFNRSFSSDSSREGGCNISNIGKVNRGAFIMKTELYSVIKSPYLTEKVSSLMGESNQYAFKVDINATKLQVKKAVEGYFSVNVEDVNIVKVKGKTKRSRYRIRKKSDWKKAYVRLADGQSIEVTSE